MHILITNDDGVEAVGLAALVDAAKKRGHTVFVCAPDKQQSAASQRIHLHEPIMAERRTLYADAETWAISGTPSDCVRIAMELCGARPDLCFSGINNGENAGCAVFYSGTVAAAREAAMHGVPAFAVSIMPGADKGMLEALAEKALVIAEQSDLQALPRLSVVNINAPAIPAAQWKGCCYAPLSQAFYLDRYERRTSPRGQDYFWVNSGLPMEAYEPGSDYDRLYKGWLTVSLIGGYADLNAAAPKCLPSDCISGER